jgi:hypothetical protein
LEVLSCLIVRVACWAELRVVSSPRSTTSCPPWTAS